MITHGLKRYQSGYVHHLQSSSQRVCSLQTRSDVFIEQMSLFIILVGH